MSTKERSAFLFDYLKYISGNDIDDLLVKARYETVNEAINNWPEIKAKLESFLLREIDEFDIEPTEEYRKLLNDLVIGSDSVLKLINEFINNIKTFQNIDSNAINEMFDKFWKNADMLHKKLSELQMTGLPNKYFEPK